jgi:hypothetical protein
MEFFKPFVLFRLSTSFATFVQIHLVLTLVPTFLIVGSQLETGQNSNTDEKNFTAFHFIFPIY